ncbi:MAG: dockerin type I repeat-containing protein, partial [Clostridia bacterium]|nr:dockerin type I repeat-containing protein [Clostridia bacterium]
IILTETLLLPEIDGDELWNLSKYVQASDQYGIASVETTPMFLRPEEVTAGKKVSVTVTNVYGLSKTAELPVAIQPVAYKNVMQDAQGAGLSIDVPAGETPRADGHLLLQCNLLEKAKYHFTVQSPNGIRRTVVRNHNTLVWNPTEAGETKVLVTIYRENGGVYQTSELNIVVADKQIFVYNTLVLSFTAESGFMMDHALQQMHKIAPGTTVLALKEAMTVAGNTGEITVSFKNAKGAEMADADLVATGTVVTVLEDGTERVSYTVLIYGDINGDGQVGIADFAKLRQELLRGNLITGIYAQATDVNYDNQIGIADFAKLRQYLLGKIKIEQK